MVCQFLLYNKWNQLYVYIYPHIPSLFHLSPTLPIPPLQGDTKYLADLPVLCSCFPLAIYFTFGSVYMSILLSHFVPAYPSPSLCPQVHSLHLRLYSCPAPIQKLFFLTRTALRRSYFSRPNLLNFNQNLSDLEEKKYPTLALSSHPLPPQRTVRELRSTCKFSVQRHRLTKTLRPNHRTIECLLFPHILPPYY